MTRVPFFQVLHRDGWQGGGHRQARTSRQTAAGDFQNVFGFLNFESLGTILNHLDVILNHLIKLDIILEWCSRWSVPWLRRFCNQSRMVSKQKPINKNIFPLISIICSLCMYLEQLKLTIWATI